MASRRVVELTSKCYCSVELPIHDEVLTHPPMSNYSLPQLNDTYSLIVLPEPEAKINAPPLPPADEPVDIVVSPPLLTNDSPSTSVTVPSLISDDDTNIKLNNPPSSSEDTPTLVKTIPPVPLSRANFNHNISSSTR